MNFYSMTLELCRIAARHIICGMEDGNGQLASEISYICLQLTIKGMLILYFEIMQCCAQLAGLVDIQRATYVFKIIN